MKKNACLLLLSLCLLAGCGGDRTLSGRVTETHVEEGTGLVSFVLHTDEGKDVGILLGESTTIAAFVDGIMGEDFRSGALSDVMVSVWLQGSRQSLTTVAGDKLAAYPAETVWVNGYRTSESAAVSDGTAVEIWQTSDGTLYGLEDGTQLLKVSSTGPENVSVGRLESFDNLTPEAQQGVLDFYETQPLPYDAQAELQKAYDEYLSLERPSDFSAYYISRNISPCASSRDVMYFVDTLLLPLADNTYQEDGVSTAFDRTTGQVIPTAELFTCPMEEVAPQLLELATGDDPALLAELSAAFQPEYITFSSTGITLCFPLGSLPSQDATFVAEVAYDQLSSLLHDWAIPEAPEE